MNGALGCIDIYERPPLGANFYEIKERRVTDIGYLLARSDAEIGKIGPSPSGFGKNRATGICRYTLRDVVERAEPG